MREMNAYGASGEPDKMDIQAGDTSSFTTSTETDLEYSNVLVNLFGIEFYTADTPLKIVDKGGKM